jgi:NADH-quinone oxidoreductase subunit M
MEPFILQVPWITLAMATPLFGALLLAFVPSEHRDVHRHLSVLFAGLSTLVSVCILARHQSDNPFLQLTTDAENIAWIPSIGARYVVGVDGLSVWLLPLAGLITTLALLAGYKSVNERVKEYHVSLLVMLGAMIGAFTALDGLLYFLFWELMLVPVLMLLAGANPGGRPPAALKFLLYTMAGSALLFTALLFLWARGGADDFGISALMETGRSLSLLEQMLVFGAMAVAFLIKVPLFPFHTWSPDAYTQAPGASAAVLSGVMAKVGIYGLVRWALPVVPDGGFALAPYISALAVIGIAYGAVVALNQTDLRRMLAYSSLSHLGFVVLGVFALTPTALSGAMFQCVAHGLTTGGLFIVATFIGDRSENAPMDQLGGLASRAPIFAMLSVGLVFASAAVPGLVGFVGEFAILVGASESYTLNFGPLAPVGDFAFGPDMQAMIFVGVAATGVVLGAIYLLVMVQRTFYGPTTSVTEEMSDISWREGAVLVPLLALCLLLGLLPGIVMERVQRSANAQISALEYMANDYAADVVDGQNREALRREFLQQRRQSDTLATEAGAGLSGSHADEDEHEGDNHE